MCVLVLLLCTPLVLAGKEEVAFAKNPNFDTFMELANPTADDLLKLHSDPKFTHIGAFKKLSPNEKVKFLRQNYVNIYAEVSLRKFTYTGASKADELEIADLFFSKKPRNVNFNQHSFRKFMRTNGVNLDLKGDVTGYKKGGIIVAKNGESNVIKLRKEFDFELDADKVLYLRRKGGGAEAPRHTFTGRLLAGKNGAALLGGTFDGKQVEHASRIYIDSKDRVVIKTKKFGSIEFARPSLLFFKKGVKGRPDKYTVQKNAKIMNIKHRVSGTFYLREGDITKGIVVPPGDVAYVNGYKVKGINDKVAVRFEEKRLKDVKNRRKNEIYVGAKSGLVMASVGTRPYEVEFDPASAIAGQQLIGQYKGFLEVPRKGYASGKKAKLYDPGSKDFSNILMIQGIVGADQIGRMTKGTEKKIKAWQNAFNKRRGLKRGDKGWLKPDGKWKNKESRAFFNDIRDTSPIVLQPQGGTASVDLAKKGLDIKVQGKFNFNAGPESYKWTNGRVIAKKGFSNPLSSAPFTMTALDSKGNEIATMRREGTETYMSALNKGFTKKELCLPCFMISRFGTENLKEAKCAGFVQRLGRVEGGWNKRYGKNEETFDEYTGRYGNAWHMASNVLAKGGESLFWKEDGGRVTDEDTKVRKKKLGKQVTYDFDNFKEGDVIGIYFTGSSYLDQALEKGFNGRQNTHVAKVMAVTEENHDFDPNKDKNLKKFVQKKTGVRNKAILASYPVWVKDDGQPDSQYRRVRIKDGKYVYEDSGKPAKITAESDVLIKKALISHLWHRGKRPKPDTREELEYDLKAIRQEDMGKLFNDHPSFSLYEHMRPNEKKMKEARKTQKSVVPVQTHDKDFKEHLTAMGFPGYEATVRSEQIRFENAIRNPRAGDVLMVSRTQTQEADSSADLPLADALDEQGAWTPQKWVDLIHESTPKRLDEFDIPEEDAEAFTLLTASVGLQESGLTSNPLGRDKIDKHGEDIVAWWGDTPLTPGRFERWAKSKGYGFYQVGYGEATDSAQALVEEGKIPENDVKKITDLTSKEGSVKHGQRYLAMMWKRYVTPDMKREDKIQMIGASFNCGQWCPRNAALQKQLSDLTGDPLKPDGKIGGTTKERFEAYAEKTGVPFDPGNWGDDLDNSAVAKEIRKRWKAKFKKNPKYARVPEWNYGEATIAKCRQLSHACSE